MASDEKDLKQEIVLNESDKPKDQVLKAGQTVDLENYENDDEFGGYESRKKIERRLLLKTDIRFMIMIISEL